jgi:hypothetical protein
MNAPAVLNFKLYEKNILRGFFDLELPSGMILTGCGLHENPAGHYWIGLPAKPFTKGDGSQSWAKIVDFKNVAVPDRFQAAIAAFEQARRVVAG